MALSKIEADSLNIGQVGGRRNLIINGAMQVAQRGTSATSISTNTYVTCDRWQQIFSGAGAWTATQASDAPDGFVKSQKYTCTTADTATDAGDYFIIRQKIEAQDLQHLEYGTSDAKQLTLSFWVKSSVTGTANATLHGDACSGGVDIICQNFTINTADTWEYKTLTFAGNTNSDGNLTSSNGIGISLWLWFKAGSTWSGGTATGNAWVDNANNRQAVGTNMNISSAVNNVVAITGVQLEVGSVATPFEHRSYGEELALCQRYYVASSNRIYKTAVWVDGDRRYHTDAIMFPVVMRANPTTVVFSDDDGSSGFATIRRAGESYDAPVLSYYKRNDNLSAIINVSGNTNFANAESNAYRVELSYTADAEL